MLMFQADNPMLIERMLKLLKADTSERLMVW